MKTRKLVKLPSCT